MGIDFVIPVGLAGILRMKRQLGDFVADTNWSLSDGQA